MNKPASEREDEEKLLALIESKNKLENELKCLDEYFENVINWISVKIFCFIVELIIFQTISNQSGSSESTSVDDGSFVSILNNYIIHLINDKGGNLCRMRS